MGYNRHLTADELRNRSSILWSNPRPMTPEQMLHVLLEEHVHSADDALSALEKLDLVLDEEPQERRPVMSVVGDEAGEALPFEVTDLCARIEGLVPGGDGADREEELARLFVRLCRNVFPERKLVNPDQAMLDRMIDFACRNGICPGSTPERFWLSVKSTMLSFHKVFSPMRKTPLEWRPVGGDVSQPSVYHGSGLREEFWDYVVLGAIRLPLKREEGDA